MIAAMAALTITYTASASAQDTPPPSPVPSSSDHNSMCDANQGAARGAIGALYYVREVMDDAIIKAEQHYADPSKRFEEIEVSNDYLCDVPRTFQPTVQYLTITLLGYILDVMPITFD